MLVTPHYSSTVFRVLGRSLYARSRSSSLEGWIRHHWERPQQLTSAYPFAVDFGEDEEAALPRAGRPANARLLGFDLPFTVGPNAAKYQERDSCVQLDMDRRYATIVASGVPARHGDRPSRSGHFWAALHVAFNEAFRASGLLPFHAAVAVRDGRATALVGPSGAGKSTTLLQTIRSGNWAVLAEDLSWLDPDRLILHGWDTGLRLWPDSIKEFAPELAVQPRPTDACGKLLLPWSAFDSPVQLTAKLDTVLILNRQGETKVPVTEVEALKTLWEATGVPLLPTIRKRVAATLPRLLDRIRFGRHILGGPLKPPA